MTSPLPKTNRYVARRNGPTWLGLLLLSVALTTHAQSSLVATNLLRQDFWDTDGTINAIDTANGVVYVGGKFSYVAPRSGKVAAVDTFTGEPQPGFPRIGGSSIRAILDDGSGGWFIGGEFNEVGGLPRTNLVHLLGDHSVDAGFAPNPNAGVFALASDGETLYVGGDFTAIGGQPRQRLASILLSNGWVTAWAPQPDGRVASLLVAEDRIFAGGTFLTIGGLGAKHLAALDPQTGGALPWLPLPDGPVLTMALLDHRLFVGGSFQIIGSVVRRDFRNNAAAVEVQTGEVLAWNPQLSGGDVTALRAVCDAIYLGGYFSSSHGTNRVRVAAVDADLGLVTSWDAGLAPTRGGGLNAFVLGLELVGDTLYLWGEFELSADASLHDLVSVDARNGRALPWNPRLDGGVSAAAVAGRTVLAGFLSAAGGVERRNIAAFDPRSGKPTDWNPGADDEVLALAAAGNKVFAGGRFTAIGSQPRARIAALDAGTGFALGSWNPGADDAVRALAFGNGTLYAGGDFSQLGGRTRLGLGALDASTGQTLTNWVANTLDGSVQALAFSGGTLYVGGSFTGLGTVNRDALAALDAVSGQVLPWNPGANDTVLALALSGNTLYVGGFFNTVASQSRDRLAAIDLPTSQATAWNPGADGEPMAFAISGNTIYVGGRFNRLGGQPRSGLAAVDDAGTLLDWNPGLSTANRVFALAATDDAVFAGGTGVRVQESLAPNSLAVFPRVGAPGVLTAPRDTLVVVGQNAQLEIVASGQPPFSYQWHFNGMPLPAATNAALVLTNLQTEQAGIYEVTVTNALGVVTAQARLTVLLPAAITVQPSDLTVPAGSNAVLSVSATGNPPPFYQWRLNGVNIPGAVFPTLSVSSRDATEGGSYQVAVANNAGVVFSRVARVVFDRPPLPFADDFAARGTILGVHGLGNGNNSAATTQTNPNEPPHAGKTGGKSVWLRWVAPATGIATFDTHGSGFDTLLGIYSGNDFSNLVAVTGDEDRGGYLTSRAVFNVTNGVEYSIAVDGLAGASGDIVLRWDLDTSTIEFPRILDPPASQTVPPGGTAQFRVVATSPTPMTFQWFFGCQAIPGATGSTLTLTNVHRRQVGTYRVFVMNASTRVAESLAAALELGPQNDSRSFDKLEDLLAALRDGGFVPASGGLGGEPLLVSMGSIVSQTFNTVSNTTSIFETSACGVWGGHSAWLAFKPATNGIVQIDTCGSLFDTVLAVYRDTNLLTLVTNPAAALVACDDDGAPDGARSLIRFEATGGTVYLALVDGANGDRGLAKVNWSLAPGPPPPPPPDTNPPALLITFPASLVFRVTNATTLTLTGTARDNVGVAHISVQAGAGPFLDATGTTNWSATLPLAPGTNVFRIRAIDAAGNFSLSNRTVVHVVTSPLDLTIVGNGFVTPITNGMVLEAGRRYTTRAVPRTGSLFSNWVNGGAVFTNPVLAFVMSPATELVANFVLNPFLQARGTYNGLFYVHLPGNVHHTNSGSFKLNVTDHGRYSASLRVGGKTYAASGNFNLDGRSVTVVKRSGLAPLEINWYLDLHGSNIVTGSVTAANWPEPAQLDGDRARFHSVTNPAPHAGRYTLLIPGTDADATRPHGDGYGTATIDGNGLVRFTGTLGDAAKVSQAVALSSNGEWPLHAMLYSTRGSILGWVNVVTNGTTEDLGGMLNWERPRIAGARVYPAGFETDCRMTGSRYRVPVGATNFILQFTNGLVWLSGGNLNPGATNEVRLGQNSVVTNLGPGLVTLKFTLKSGLFSGTMKPGGAAVRIAVAGAVHQKRNYGAGCFLGTNQTGRVTLEAAPVP